MGSPHPDPHPLRERARETSLWTRETQDYRGCAEGWRVLSPRSQGHGRLGVCLPRILQTVCRECPEGHRVLTGVPSWGGTVPSPWG